MNTDENKQAEGVDPQENTGEEGTEGSVVQVSKDEYDKMNQTLGSLKRELKDLKKSKESTQETPTSNATDGKLLEKVERIALRTAGITHQDDVELAQKTAKKWGVDIDEVLEDPDFKVKLERQQTDRSNVTATSDIKGSGNAPANAKNTPDYWLAKGVPPTPADVPDGATRRKIISDMRKQADSGTGSQFYNS